MLKAKCGSCGIIKTFDELLKLGALLKDQHEKLYIMLKAKCGSFGIIKTLDELLKVGAISKDKHEKLYIGYLI